MVTEETKTDKSEQRRDLQDKLLNVGLKTYRIYSDNDVNVFSGNATLYILMAFVPFFALIAGLINFLPEEYLISFFDMLSELFPDIPQIQSLMKNLLTEINPETGTLVVSVSLLSMLGSASRGVSGLQLGLLRISANKTGWIGRKITAYIYTVLFIFMLIALLFFRVLRSAILSITQQLAGYLNMPEIADIISGIMNNGGLITLIGIAVIVVITYTFLQGNTHKIRQQLPGAVFTTALWIGFTVIFEWFIGKFWNASAVYGSFASVFLTVLWLNIMITILMAGACLNEAMFRIAESEQEEINASVPGLEHAEEGEKHGETAQNNG